MLAHFRYNEGTELALLILNVYKESRRPVDEVALATILTIFDMYKDSSSPAAISGRELLIKQAIQWSASLSDFKHGHPSRHSTLAISMWKQVSRIVSVVYESNTREIEGKRRSTLLGHVIEKTF